MLALKIKLAKFNFNTNTIEVKKISIVPSYIKMDDNGNIVEIHGKIMGQRKPLTFIKLGDFYVIPRTRVTREGKVILTIPPEIREQLAKARVK